MTTPTTPPHQYCFNTQNELEELQDEVWGSRRYINRLALCVALLAALQGVWVWVLL